MVYIVDVFKTVYQLQRIHLFLRSELVSFATNDSPKINLKQVCGTTKSHRHSLENSEMILLLFNKLLRCINYEGFQFCLRHSEKKSTLQHEQNMQRISRNLSYNHMYQRTTLFVTVLQMLHSEGSNFYFIILFHLDWQCNCGQKVQLRCTDLGHPVQTESLLRCPII